MELDDTGRYLHELIVPQKKRWSQMNSAAILTGNEAGSDETEFANQIDINRVPNIVRVFLLKNV